MIIVIAFLGGMISLLSPCTLPVIPFLFSGCQGKYKQIIALLGGMVAMFTTVALLATTAGDWIINATIFGRWVSLVILAIAALMLIFPHFSQHIAKPAVIFGNRVNNSSNNTNGVPSSFLTGLAVGLLWSPCAGPILGAIYSIGFSKHAHDGNGILFIAYGCGFATMLALLQWGGRRLLTPIRKNTRLIECLRQGGGVIMLSAVILSATGFIGALQGSSDVSNKLELSVLKLRQYINTPENVNPVIVQDYSDESRKNASFKTIPVSQEQSIDLLSTLQLGGNWINGEPVTSEMLKGKVVLVQFWTWDCINCKHVLPHIRDWANTYQSQGLVVIGVHTPELPWERPLISVKKAVDKWQLPYRVVTDNDDKIWNSFGNTYWPAQYYFDTKGQLRYTSFGEGNYEKQEQTIQSLLKESHV